MKLLIIERYPIRENFIPEIFFKNKGLEVTFLNTQYLHENLLFRLSNKFTTKIFINYINSIIISNFKGFDAVLFYNVDYVKASTLKIIKTHNVNTKIMCMHGDDMLNKKFGENEESKVALIDVHISPRKHLSSVYKKLGANTFIETDWYYKSLRTSPSNKIHDISFCGAISSKRIQILKDIKIENSVIVGNGWNNNNNSFPKNLKHLSIEKMNNIISASKISLNILTIANNDKTNFRNFEIPSQFSLQICERSDELESIFEEDKNIVFFDNKDELNDKIQYYLKNDVITNKIIRESNKLVSDTKFTQEYQLEKIYNHLIS